MAIFNYHARTPEGELQVGTVEASSKEAAVDLLQTHKLIVVDLEPEEAIPIYFRKLELFEYITLKEVAVFSRQLATLVEAQVSLLDSLKTLADQTTNPRFKGKIFEVLADVDGGESFSRALSKHPKVFSRFYISMVRSGELSGRLQEVLSYLADHLEREWQIRTQIRNSLIYPLFVLVSFFIVGGLMMIFVIPQLLSVVQETGEDLPLITRIMLVFAKWARVLAIPVLILMPFLGFLVAQYYKTKEGREMVDRILLKLPIFKIILTNLYITRFSENLGTLVEGGIPIAQAIRVTGETIGNTVYEKILQDTEEAVRRGETISSILRRSPREFPPLVTQMVATGEASGRLDLILKNLSRFYQRELNYLVDNLLTVIEPALIVILGAGVGLLVASILIPIYNLVGSI